MCAFDSETSLSKSSFFAHLTPSDFEEFIYELLGKMGFKNVNWRKGANSESSPADQGRDIECTHLREDPDNTQIMERWFVECKHRKLAVSARELAGLLTCAEAERPEKVVIATSGFLSNPAKEHIRAYERNNSPPFRITFWEGPMLESFASTYPDILRKFNLAEEAAHLALMHPMHIEYLRNPLLSDLPTFFECLETIGAEDRDHILGWTWALVVSPQFRTPVTGDETLGELMIGDLSYERFKTKCYSLANHTSQYFIVSSVVSNVLQWLLSSGDLSAIERYRSRNELLLERLAEMRARGCDDDDTLNSMEQMAREMLTSLPDRMKRNYELYQTFCERVLLQLYLRDPFRTLDHKVPHTGS